VFPPMVSRAPAMRMHVSRSFPITLDHSLSNWLVNKATQTSPNSTLSQTGLTIQRMAAGVCLNTHRSARCICANLTGATTGKVKVTTPSGTLTGNVFLPRIK
jgi:hypothetical protein